MCTVVAVYDGKAFGVEGATVDGVSGHGGGGDGGAAVEESSSSSSAAAVPRCPVIEGLFGCRHHRVSPNAVVPSSRPLTLVVVTAAAVAVVANTIKYYQNENPFALKSVSRNTPPPPNSDFLGGATVCTDHVTIHRRRRPSFFYDRSCRQNGGEPIEI